MSKKVLITLFCACVLFFSNLVFVHAAEAKGGLRRGFRQKSMLATPCTASVFPFSIGNPEVDPIATVTVSNDITGAASVLVTLHTSAGFPAASNVVITPAFSNCPDIQGKSCTGYPQTSCAEQFSCASCPVQPSGTVTVAITSMNGQTTYTQAFPYTFCCPVLGCTRTAGYWACHTDNWPVDPSTLFCEAITSVSPSAECPNDTLTLLQVMQSTSETPWYFLAKEWVAAYLNISVAYGSVNEILYGSCIECPSCSTICTAETNAFDAAAGYLGLYVELKDLSSIGTVVDPEMLCLENYLNEFNLGFLEGLCPNFCRDDGCPTCQQCKVLGCDCIDLGCMCAIPTCETLGCKPTCEQCSQLCDCAALGCSVPTPTCADIGCTCDSLGCVCPPPNCTSCPINCNSCMEACQLCVCKEESSSSSR
jgi:hypothetical protein